MIQKTKQQLVRDGKEAFTQRARPSVLKALRIKARKDEIDIGEIVEAGIIIALDRTPVELKSIRAEFKGGK